MKRLALIATLVLAGCGSTASPGPTASASTPPLALVASVPPAASSTPAATAQPTPSPLPSPTQDEIRAAAAKAYSATVKPANAARDALYKKYKNARSLTLLRAYCAKLAKVEGTEARTLNAIAYPVDTAGDAKTLVRADAAAEADLRSCAVARSAADWNSSWSLVIKANDRAHEAANLVRLDLGLPAVPG